MTSKSEGSPNVVLEAQSNGVPTVSVPIDANEGIIKNNYNGVIINNRDPNSFFNGVIKAIRMRKKLSKNSKLFFKKKFDINKNISQLRKIFLKKIILFSRYLNQLSKLVVLLKVLKIL